jgi:uncharacterized surface protein with fasciclin (FAS1) repeats
MLAGCQGDNATATVEPPGGGGGGGGGGGTATGSIPEVLRADSEFSTLVSLLEATGLDETLAAGGPYTLFAPTNAAFAKVPPATLEALEQDPVALKNLLLYHAAEGTYTSEQLRGMTSLATMLGPSLAINAGCPSGALFVNNAQVVGPDIPATNGIIHAIDSVLIPPPA